MRPSPKQVAHRQKVSRTSELAKKSVELTSSSWWIGKSRAEFPEAQRAEAPRMLQSRFAKVLLPTWTQD